MIKRSNFALVALTSAALLAGCASNSEETKAPTQLSAYAASSTYPTNSQAQKSTNVGVLVEPASKILRILNFGDAPLANVDVWVNGTYVYKVDTIPANGSMRLDESMFYDHAGHALSAQEVRINSVQLFTGNQLWTALGPIAQ